MSSISTDWSIQSIPVKSDLPIFIDWLLRVEPLINLGNLHETLLKILYI